MTHPNPRKPAEDPRRELRRAYGQMAGDLGNLSDDLRGHGCGAGGIGSQPACAGATPEAAAELPDDLAALSLGSGEPVLLAELEAGQTVLDLGSGAGLDCFLAARKVGPGGRVIGVDMTAAMIDRARALAGRLGVTNVEFRLGEIEHLPVADGTLDVVISNCVLNLSPDRGQAFREIFRVLRPGGLLALSDILIDRPLPAALLEKLAERAAGAVAPADEESYLAALEAAGFVDLEMDRELLGSPPSADALGEPPAGGGGPARPIVQVKVGETGETLAEIDLASLPDPGAIPRSFRASLRARKPERAPEKAAAAVPSPRVSQPQSPEAP